MQRFLLQIPLPEGIDVNVALSASLTVATLASIIFALRWKNNSDVYAKITTSQSITTGVIDALQALISTLREELSFERNKSETLVKALDKASGALLECQRIRNDCLRKLGDREKKKNR